MSLSRIFALARRQGLPVIVTDPEGDEPMVVMPLEHYEDLTGGESLDDDWMDELKMEDVEGPDLDHPAPKAEDQDRPWSKPDWDDLEDGWKLPTNDDLESIENESESDDPKDDPLEESFYLEPLDDKD